MRFPKMSLHPSGQWRVRFNGKSFYLGKDKPKAQKQYKQLLIDEYGPVALGRDSITVGDLLERFKADYLLQVAPKWLKTKTDFLKQMMQPAILLYGGLPVEEFGPLAFQQVRSQIALLENLFC